jgi:hypothetical protein
MDQINEKFLQKPIEISEKFDGIPIWEKLKYLPPRGKSFRKSKICRTGENH